MFILRLFLSNFKKLLDFLYNLKLHFITHFRCKHKLHLCQYSYEMYICKNLSLMKFIIYYEIQCWSIGVRVIKHWNLHVYILQKYA